MKQGILLEDLTWLEAEERLKPDTIVVIPLGAAAKEHGPHLKLKNDFLLAEYYKEAVRKSADVVIAPTVNYHYYPAFVEYPGSITLSKSTAIEIIVDICRSLHRFGPWRFYVLNTGVSTIQPLNEAKLRLSQQGILLEYTDIDKMPFLDELSEQEGGSHADEIETSMMLYIAPTTVDMSKATKDYVPHAKGALTRNPSPGASYSPSGIWGDATLATKEKGEQVIHFMVKEILKDIAKLKSTLVNAI